MFQFVLHWNSENSFYSIWNLCHEITKMNNWSEKSRSFLFQSAILKTMRNERKLMVKQFAAEEVIFLCQYLPNNKSITIMIHHCNFFINKYGPLLPSNVSWRRTPIGRWGRPWLAAGRRLAPMRSPRRDPAQVCWEESWDSWRVAGGAAPDLISVM